MEKLQQSFYLSIPLVITPVGICWFLTSGSPSISAFSRAIRAIASNVRGSHVANSERTFLFNKILLRCKDSINVKKDIPCCSHPAATLADQRSLMSLFFSLRPFVAY